MPNKIPSFTHASHVEDSRTGQFAETFS